MSEQRQGEPADAAGGEPFTLEREGGVELRALDVAGDAPTVVLLHGLAGHAGEWQPVIRAIAGRSRVVALDQRGHGFSTQMPADMSRQAHVDDVAALAERVSPDRPVVLVGQSMGGNTAMLTAARHPELVAALVLIDAAPDGPKPTATFEVRLWLASWPRSFASYEVAVRFFGGGTVGHAWADGLAVTEDGLRPRFDRATIVRALSAMTRQSWWSQWRAVRCSTVVVRGGKGWVPRRVARRMERERNDNIEVIDVPGAGHDVHLDRPDRVAEIIVDLADGIRTA